MTKRTACGMAAAALALALAASSARAAETTPVSPASGSTHWYGDQLLAVRALGLAAMFGGAQIKFDNGGAVVMGVGLGTYVLGAPAVQLAHGRPGRALGGLVGSAVAITGGFFVGAALAPTPPPSCRDLCPFGHGIKYGLIGSLAASTGWAIVEAITLADEPAPPPAATAAAPSQGRPRRTRPTVVPSVAVGPTGGMLGLVGRF
jgi:hypothetical protein